MIELFSGIGCQRRGIENTGLFDVEVVATSEIDKEAIVSYAAVHEHLNSDLIENYNEYPTEEQMRSDLTRMNIGYVPEKNKTYNWESVKANKLKRYWLANKLSKNLGDITGIESLPYADLWTLSAPCTDISVAGQLKGLAPDDNTRSSLLWQNIRLLEKAIDDGIQPKYLFLENVKNLVGKRFKPDFEIFLSLLDDLGYNAYWSILNGRDCGVPQNRERVFVIFIRKDIDTGLYEFPKPFDNGKRLKDVLEEHVPEKYYLKTEKAQKLIDQLIADGTLDG